MNREFISIGPITIYWYSITMLLGILCAIFIALREAKRKGQYDFVQNIMFYIIIFGIIGARLYYVIFNFEAYKYNLIDILKVWEGGLAIYGGIIAGFLVTVYYSKKYHKAIIDLTDTFAPALIMGQAIGRWGNFFNSEAHGGIVSRMFLENMHIPKFIIDGMYIDGVYYHPTFLYESLWCFLGFIILLTIRKITKRKKGIVTYTYFIWYGIGRFLIEGLRTDSLYLGSIRISQLVSICLVIVGVLGIIYNIYKEKR